MSNPEWRGDYLWFARMDIQGEKISGDVMVRTVNGKRQYRRETVDEATERFDGLEADNGRE